MRCKALKQKFIYSIVLIFILYILGVAQYQILLQRLSQSTKPLPTNENSFLNKPFPSSKPSIPKDDTSAQTKENNEKNKNANLKLYAKSAALIDASNGRVLFQKNGKKEMPMASTTKIMTCIVTLENATLDDIVTISKNAAKQPDVQLNAQEGEQFKLEDLLYSLMLESHNDVAVAIAEHVGGSVEGFASLMNEKAKELGCTHTQFVTPNGLDADGHYTTAEELCRIAAYAIQNEEFMKITNTPSWTFQEIKKGRSFSVSNKDKFLYLYKGAIGVKTGFTGKAGYCFVGAVEKDGKKFVSAVLACGWPPSKNYKWSDTTLLMNYGVENFTWKDITNYNATFPNIPVVDGQKTEVALDAKQKEISLLLQENETVHTLQKIPSTLSAPIKKNTTIGKMQYYVNDTLYAEIPIYTKEDIAKIDFNFCCKKLLRLWSFSS